MGMVFQNLWRCQRCSLVRANDSAGLYKGPCIPSVAVLSIAIEFATEVYVI